MKEQALKPVKGTPNAVSTQTLIQELRMKPLSYGSNKERTVEAVKMVMEQIPRAELVDESEHSLHYVVTTKLMRFKDDVEFLFDDDARQVEFRSASRVGKYDFGVNRKRMKLVGERYRRLIR